MRRSLSAVLLLWVVVGCSSSDSVKPSVDAEMMWTPDTAVKVQGPSGVPPSDSLNSSVDPGIIWTPDTTIEAEIRMIPTPDSIDSEMMLPPR